MRLLPAGAALEFPSIKKMPPFPCPQATRRSHGCHTLKHPGNIKTQAHKDTRESERKKSNTQNRDHQAWPLRLQTDSERGRIKHFYCFFLDELTVFQCTQMELGKPPFPSPNQVMGQRWVDETAKTKWRGAFPTETGRGDHLSPWAHPSPAKRSVTPRPLTSWAGATRNTQHP